MNLRLTDIAKLVDGKITGDTEVIINSVARIDEADKGDLTFLYLQNFEKFFAATGASAILVKPEFNKTRDDISYIEVNEPEVAFNKILILY